MSKLPVICEVRYSISSETMDEFRAYAQIWVKLIERYGGEHDGYLISTQAPAGATVSFPDVGEDEPGSTAVARFTFADDEAYRSYRDEVAKDAEAIEANSRYGKNPPFKGYQRVFLEPLV